MQNVFFHSEKNFFENYVKTDVYSLDKQNVM